MYTRSRIETVEMCGIHSKEAVLQSLISRISDVRKPFIFSAQCACHIESDQIAFRTRKKAGSSRVVA